LDNTSEGSYHESGSKFFAFAFPADRREILTQHLEELKTLHPKARHLCYAYRITVGDEVIEYASDAGEPSGSAGQPILRELRRNDLLNVAVIVVRYFGGTKLGIPGLINAYRESARMAIENGILITITRTQLIRVEMPIGLEPKFYSACKHLGIAIDDTNYDQRFCATVRIPVENTGEILNQLLSLTSGREGTLEDLCKRMDITLYWLERG
jgi:uncharacterized YigZ family protein